MILRSFEYVLVIGQIDVTPPATSGLKIQKSSGLLLRNIAFCFYCIPRYML